MNINSLLPKDRTKEGRVEWAGNSLRCRGKADNQAAMQHGNPSRDPTRPYGDHPSGGYLVYAVEDVPPEQRHSFGPFKIRLKELTGDALTRSRFEHADPYLELHGGDPAPDGVTLRATYGCLRMDNSTIEVLTTDARAALSRGEVVSYVCTDV